jgi:hypothetical protein
MNLKAFAEGGFIMWLVLLAGLGTTAACVLQLAMLRRINLIPVINWGITGTFFLGALGMILGMIQAYESIGGASPEERAVLLSKGIAVSMNPLALALQLCVFLAVLAAATVTIKVNLNDEDDPEPPRGPNPP